jgi:hypothetical protein
MSGDIEYHISHADELFNRQVNWRATWQELSDYVYPVKSNIETIETPGEIRATERYDTTAEEAMLDAASGLVGWLTPIGEAWFRYESEAKGVSEDVSRWYKECTERATEALFASNFYLSFFESMIDAMTFGTYAIFTETTDNKLLNFVSWPIGTYAFTVNNEGDPDTVVRKWKWTARQAVLEWGEEAVGETIRKAYEEGGKQAEKEFEFFHKICPRERGKWKPGIVEGKLRPIASYYICKDTKTLIEEDGYYEMPVVVGRILKSNSEIYGRSPGMGVLPEVKMLNQMEHDLLLALEKMVNPPWLMPDDSDYAPDNRANGVTYYRAGSQSLPQQQEFRNRVDLGEQKTEQKRDRIRKAYFNDMFQMLSNPDVNQKQKTAFEVARMVEERIVLFTPIFARIIQEGLNKMLERTFGILYRAQAFTQPPPDVVETGGAYEITYVSRIALAIKSLQNGQLMQALDFIRGMMEIDPHAGKLLNTQKAGKGALLNLSIPQDWVNTDEDIQAMIEAENQQMQMAQAAQMAQMGADAVGKLPPEMQKQLTSA